MTLILRVECPQGKGPYAPGPYSKSAIYAHEYGGCPLDYTRHPEPSDDETLAPHFALVKAATHPTLSFTGTRFGFTSPQQYLDWFYTIKARKLLDSMGYMLVLYFVEDEMHVISGESQALFDRDRARLFSRIPCDASLEVIEQSVKDAETYFSSPND